MWIIYRGIWPFCVCIPPVFEHVGRLSGKFPRSPLPHYLVSDIPQFGPIILYINFIHNIIRSTYYCPFNQLQGLGFKVLGFRVLGFRIQGLGFQGFQGFRVQGCLGFRVQGLGFRVWDLGFRVLYAIIPMTPILPSNAWTENYIYLEWLVV